jgi:2-(1,2-epoxy-1,2-dihydrophenyl)acetyl-CoA isomerase
MNNKVLLKIEDGIATITLNDPKSMNALSDELFTELSEATDIVASDADVKVVVLTGSGKAFCAGGDLKKLSEGFTTVEGYEYMKGFHNWVKKWMNMEKPVIAAVNGFAVGAGFCIATLCDMIYASEKAKFGQAFVNVGLIPDLAGMYTLPRLVGLQRAKELIFTGKTIDVNEAYSMGIVNKITKHDELEEEVNKLANKLKKGPSVAIGMAKTVANQSINMTLDQLLELESNSQAQCFQTEDHKIALKAFFNKEKPVFKGK